MWNYQSDAAVPGALLGNPVDVKSEDADKPAMEESIEVSPTDVTDASGVEEEQA